MKQDNKDQKSKAADKTDKLYCQDSSPQTEPSSGKSELRPSVRTTTAARPNTAAEIVDHLSNDAQSKQEFSSSNRPQQFPRSWSNIIRCLFFWPVWAAFTAVNASALIVLFWMPAQWSYEVARFWCAGSLKLYRWILGIDYRIVGRDNIEDLSSCVVVANHESSWETTSMTVILPTLTWVIKYELIFVPFFGQVVFLTRPIMLKRSQKFRALSKIVDQGMIWLKRGRWVCIFPQGTRQPNVAKPRFHIGAAALAVQAGCRILPIVHNSGQYWGSGVLDKRPGTITIVIGKAFETVDAQGQARPIEEVQQQITETLHTMRAEIS